MSFFAKVIKAIISKRKLIHYKSEKALQLHKFINPDDSDISRKETPTAKLTRKRRKNFRAFFQKLRNQKRIPPFLWKSFVGFFGGILLTYVFFFFFIIGINYSLKSATYVCTILGMVFSIGLAFSSKIRCYVLLMIPVFFSKQGRQALTAYAFFLAITGPVKNTTNNMMILTDSIACGQDLIKNAAGQIYEMIKTPFKSVKETITKISKSVKEVVDSIKAVISSIKRIILGILNVIKAATSWLGSIVNFCNKKLGTPFQRCMKTFDDAIEDCKAKLGIMDFLCHVVHAVKGLCYTVKWLDFICMFTDFVSDVIVGTVKRKLKEFSLHVENIFHVSIEFSHTYEFDTKSSSSAKAIAKSIVKEIKGKLEKAEKFFNIMNFALGLFFFFIFIKVYYYKYKYLSSDKYDNNYISKYITELDVRRAKMNKETVLPLEPREKKKFAPPTAIRLLKEEKERMLGSLFFLTLTTFEVISFIITDYCLYWILRVVHQAGFREFGKVSMPESGVHVEGKGVLADFYRKLGNAFKIPGDPNASFDQVRCLPDPIPPDYGRYMQIGFLIGLCWFIAFTEPYGLRLRNAVMSKYYPDRARERAVWLYNHILRSRGGFLKFARRQLRRKFQDDDTVEKVSFLQRLRANFPILSSLFGERKENTCILCGRAESTKEPLKRCPVPDCIGAYCLKCYLTIQNICTICQNPLQYGDLSDISEERDSSDEDLNIKTDDSRATESSGKSDTEYESDDKRPFQTFKELETRERFKDIEANKKIDYVKINELQEDKTALKKSIKEAIKNRLKTLESKSNSKIDKISQEAIKSRIKNLLEKMKTSEEVEETKEDKTKLINEIKKRLSQNPNLIDANLLPVKFKDNFEKYQKPKFHRLLNKLPKKDEEKELLPIDESDEVKPISNVPVYKKLITNVKSKIDKLSENVDSYKKSLFSKPDRRRKNLLLEDFDEKEDFEDFTEKPSVNYHMEYETNLRNRRYES